MDSKKFGKLVYDLRIKHKMTQKELGDKLFVSDKTISKWECGKGLPDVSLLIPLADLFGISVRELMDGKLEEKTTITNKDININVKKAIDFKNEFDKKKRRKITIIKIVVSVLIIFIAIFITNIYMVNQYFVKPIFVMNSFNSHVHTEDANYYEKNYTGLGYNFYTRGQMEDGEYSIDYVETSIFGHTISKNAKGVGWNVRWFN